MMYAEVAVHSAVPHRDTFSYSLPDGLDVQPGHAVYVPFGRLTLQGIVMEVHDTPVFSPPEKVRPIRSLIGERPLLDADRVALAKWIASYYVAPIFSAIELMLPPGFGRRPVTLLRALVAREELDGLDLTGRQRDVLDAVVGRDAVDAGTLRDHDARAIDNAIVQLERAGFLVREHLLTRPRVSGKTEIIVSLLITGAAARRCIDDAAPAKRSRRADVLNELLERREIASASARRLAGSPANLERLVRSGSVRYDRDGHHVQLAQSPIEAATEARVLRRTRRAAQALAAIAALERRGPRTLAGLRAEAGTDAATIRWLSDLGVVALEERGVERDPLALTDVPPTPTAVLLPAQAAAADAICAAIESRRHEAFLLHGVTGSGKTEVYLHALDRCVASGRRAIATVPEIALTPQTVRRFRERFERVAVLHSGLSDGEMFDQWHGIAAGRYDVVIGARSAVFAPQPHLGLIVVDEEHEWTYKQQDTAPRYHAREAAIELGRLSRAVVVLGSATPDVVSYERAERGELRLLTLPERVRPAGGHDGHARPATTPAMPRVSVVDLREELRAGNRSIFSRELRDAVEAALTSGEQAILFLNRRGMAGHVQCRDCGYVPECPGCSVALTYHRREDRLVCHQCDRQLRLPAKCRQCGSPRVRLLGIGVEKVEWEAARAFPGARLLRWDSDVTRAHGSHDRILATFVAREADILIGTQMLAKGLDLPGVTVVGVVSADLGLHLPDFRAGERTFQLLTQVAGRAGRGDRLGRVIIQTYTPDHYAIDAAARYDYDGFLDAELRARREAAYPPYARLVRMQFAHTNGKYAHQEALRMARALTLRRAELGSDAHVVGPSPAYVPRVRGRWRWQLLLRGRDPASLVRDLVLPRGWALDVDPASVL